MRYENIEIGIEVVRAYPKGDVLVGNRGTIIEKDDEKKKVRVQWSDKKTWIKVERLEPTSIPYRFERKGAHLIYTRI